MTDVDPSVLPSTLKAVRVNCLWEQKVLPFPFPAGLRSLGLTDQFAERVQDVEELQVPADCRIWYFPETQ